VRRRGKAPAWDQLELWQPGDCPAGADLTPTSALLRNPGCPRVLQTVRQVRTFFPELDGTAIKVGLTRRAAGLAAREEPAIWINPRRLTRHTVAHELVHLLQFRGLLPAGERSADLHALARHRVLVDDSPWYLKIPHGMTVATGPLSAKVPGLLHDLACEALRRREAGLRTYLRWFETELPLRWRDVRATSRRTATPSQIGLFGE
jgi:hypothetical protein